jgi:hypothetical protein
MARKDKPEGDDQVEEAQTTEEVAVEKAAPVEEPNVGLVKLRKGDEVLHVHPTTVKSHITAGWKHA